MKKCIIKVADISTISDKYPVNFIKFCDKEKITPSKINTNKGRALSLMLAYPDNYFTRKECGEVFNKFNIKTNDSIQSFNKHDQQGIKCSNERGKYYVVFPYEITNKYKMRKNFKYDGTEKSKNDEIDNIKNHLTGNYIDVPNKDWQLGHKNPDIKDNSSHNLVLQPPIQGKYRDNYIFIDTITKMPTPKKLKKMIKNKQCPYSNQQLLEFRDLLNSLKL